jgi:hypothetical protein
MIAYRVFICGFALMLVVPFCRRQIRQLFRYPR